MARSTEQSLEKIARSLEELAKNSKRGGGSTTVHQVFPEAQVLNQDLVASVPVKLDWLEPPIAGLAHILEHTGTGEVQIRLLFSYEDSQTIKRLVMDQPVEALRVSSVQP
jgi:hypothetical protein